MFLLTDAADEVVGAQVVNIDPLGRKSTVAPVKQTFTGKPEPQAALRLLCGEPAEGAADLVVVEGLENALACWKAGVGRHIIGVPGVSRLEKVELPKGADVVFFRDGKDAPDSEAAATAGRALACWYLAGVRLRVAETPMGQDANAVLLACAAEGLRRLGEEAEPYDLPAEGAPKAAVDATAQRHATLRKDDPVGYERERKEVAKKLGSRTSTWDAVVARVIAQTGEDAAGQGIKFTLPDPEPYAEPVDGAELLNDIARTVSCFLVLPSGGSSLLALWVVHTHAHDAADHSPILAVTSAEKRCGKTNLLHLLLRLTPRAFESANITAAVLFRVTEACRPTFLIDEADTFLRDDDLRGMLNKGHSKEGAFVPRCVGDEHEPRKFSVWTPKAIACIGSLHPTLTDRAISIRMKRRLKSERVERYRARRHGPRLQELCSKAARWAADHRHLLEDADPSLPEALDDRAMDNWRPLVAIADAAGGDWPERARKAALLLSSLAEDEFVGVLLLADIRRVFDTKKVARIPSTELSAALGAMEDSPWAEYGRVERPISSKKVACSFANSASFRRTSRWTEKDMRTAIGASSSRTRGSGIRGTPLRPKQMNRQDPPLRSSDLRIIL